MTFIIEHYNGHVISFRRGDGYVNATALCRANGKLWAHYDENQESRIFREHLALTIGIPIVKLVESTEGRTGGTWVHPDIAVDLAMWCSPKCRVWIVQKINELRTRGVITIAHDDGPAAAVDAALGIGPMLADVVTKAVESTIEPPRRGPSAETRRLLMRVIERFYGGQCPFPFPDHEGSLQVEHMFAKGDNQITALWVSCRKHNVWKNGLRTDDERAQIRAAFERFQLHLKTVQTENQGELFSPPLIMSPIPPRAPLAPKIVYATPLPQVFPWCPRCGTDLTGHTRCPRCGTSEGGDC
jgi:hypothetical protein